MKNFYEELTRCYTEVEQQLCLRIQHQGQHQTSSLKSQIIQNYSELFSILLSCEVDYVNH